LFHSKRNLDLLVKCYKIYSGLKPLLPIFQLFEPLVADLRHLEQEGIAGIAVYCGDNLELHELGMFHRSFSGGHVCRYCLMHYGNIGDCDGFLRHQLWDEKKYDAIVLALENGGDVENFSLRGNCVLNELDSFHATRSLGPDLMHDFMEGTVNDFIWHHTSTINVRLYDMGYKLKIASSQIRFVSLKLES
jgi:hypothetical protein